MSCLDTTYFIDFIRNPEIVRNITAIAEKEGILYTTVITVHETMSGSYCVKDDIKRAHLVDKLGKAFTRVEVLDYTRKDALKSAEISGTLMARGINVGNDAIVAGIALNNGLHVITRNRKHFEPIQEYFGLTTKFY